MVCYDLEAHEKYTGKTLRARREFETPKEVIIDGWTIDGAVAGPAFRSLAGKVKIAVEKLPAETQFPYELEIDGTSIVVNEEHVKRLQRNDTITGEWFIPHVVEPAFGIDRIIWHILDHAFEETTKQGENYTLMKLNPNVVPVDYSVFPLFEKDGMKELALEINNKFNERSGIVSTYDSSGSIGRRYARADEIGFHSVLLLIINLWKIVLSQLDKEILENKRASQLMNCNYLLKVILYFVKIE